MISTVRGMKDVFGNEMSAWHHVENVVRTTSALFGYSEFRTPILEHTELFARGVGEETDIVGKEMYTFDDRGGDSLTLRPEMTAPIVRAAIQHNLLHDSPTTRLWYMGPLFRYERPQRGRYRQFHQYGAEILGSPNPEADAEIIHLACEVLRRLQIPDVVLEINSLGSSEARTAYRTSLVSYLRQHEAQLSADSQRRLETNPLRVLDSKDEADKAIIEKAPRLIDHLDESSTSHFKSVLALLDTAGIVYRVNHHLVRGLDYYSHTVFEFKSLALGSQDTVCGGGRYDPLFGMLGGGDVPAVGFSIGIERLLLIMESNGLYPVSSSPDVYICSFCDAARLPVQLMALRLRRSGLRTIVDLLRRSAKAQMKEAGKSGARFCILIGDDELTSSTAVIKDMASGTQITVQQTDLEHALSQRG